MTYCTVEDVQMVTGYTNADFSFLNNPMSLCQFNDMIQSFIDDMETQINRYCNVLTFAEHTITNEYHTLKGYDAGDYRMGFYSPARAGTQFFTESYNDVVRILFLREQPVQEITKIEVNKNVNYTDGPQWVELHEYGVEYEDEEGDTQVGKDYQVITKFETTYIYFIRNFPQFGKNNVRITYKAGYSSTDPVWKALRSACRISVVNLLNYKMRQQQISTLRGSSISDYSSLFMLPGDDFSYLTKDVKDILDRYRVPALPIDMYD